jgi:hypothetical protein
MDKLASLVFQTYSELVQAQIIYLREAFAALISFFHASDHYQEITKNTQNPGSSL